MGTKALYSAEFWVFIGIPTALAQAQQNPPSSQPLVIPPADLPLLQPLDDRTNSLSTQNANDALEAFINYFNLSWPWVIGTAAGIAVLQALVGGIQIMLSGGDGGAREEGKNRMTWALAGLLMIGLSGMILEILNPIYFRQA
jgi:hypothetical protein